jgi:hypothetical protein
MPIYSNFFVFSLYLKIQRTFYIETLQKNTESIYIYLHKVCNFFFEIQSSDFIFSETGHTRMPQFLIRWNYPYVMSAV